MVHNTMISFYRPRIALTIAVGLACTCWREIPMEKLSVMEVLESSRDLNGKRVSVCGIARVAFEHTAIYPSVESASQGIGPAIWLDIDAESFQDLNMNAVEIAGVFDKDGRGHMGMFDGEIKSVENI